MTFKMHYRLGHKLNMSLCANKNLNQLEYGLDLDNWIEI